jgi:hypothetical protein
VIEYRHLGGGAVVPLAVDPDRRHDRVRLGGVQNEAAGALSRRAPEY